MLELEKREVAGTLADVIDRILDKGVVINADITISVAGVELLGIQIRAAIASLETAAQWGLAMPLGINREAPAWKNLTARESCPSCQKRVALAELRNGGCHWCGWVSPRSLTAPQL